MKSPRSRALDLQKLPKEYQEFELQERRLAIGIASGKCVLDVGCGEGRAVPYLAPIADYYYGIDIDKDMLEAARKYQKEYPNIWFVEGDARKLSEHFSPESMDVSVCLFSTLGSIEEPEKVLGEIRKVTKDKLLFDVMAKGAIPARKKYYEALGFDYEIDPQTETIYSKVWGESRAYSLGEVMELARKAGWDVREIGTLAGLAHYAIARK